MCYDEEDKTKWEVIGNIFFTNLWFSVFLRRPCFSLSLIRNIIGQYIGHMMHFIASDPHGTLTYNFMAAIATH